MFYFPGCSQKFLAASAPKAAAFKQFWRMVIHEKVPVIVMITKLVEDKKRKAHQYWPDDGDGEESLGLVFELGGGIRVEHLSSSFQGSYFIRRFCIQLQDGSQREVVQLHTEMWPDLTAPDEPRSFTIILSPVLNSEKNVII